jgi:predicted nucleotidyltransferase
MDYFEDTGITHAHLKRVKALANKYKVPVYIMGSRARGKVPPSHDLDLAFVVDNPTHAKIVEKKYEEMSRDARLIEDVQHDPRTIRLNKIKDIFPDTYSTYSGYIITPGNNEITPFLK